MKWSELLKENRFSVLAFLGARTFLSALLGSERSSLLFDQVSASRGRLGRTGKSALPGRLEQQLGESRMPIMKRSVNVSRS